MSESSGGSVPGAGVATDARRPAPTGSGTTTRAAWVVIVLISAIPAIGFAELTGGVPDWLVYVQLAVPAGLFAASWVLGALRPLRRFAVAMAAVLALPHLVARLDLAWQPLQSLFGDTAFDARMQAEQTGKLLVSLAVIGVLFLLGYRRRECFLTLGDLRAPIRPVRVLGFPKPDPWLSFGLQWGFYIAAAIAVALYLTSRPAVGFAEILPMLPSVVFYAALNSLNEELTIRVPMLTTLEPAVGSTQALWQSAMLFGVAHYFGIPGGLVGSVVSVFMGWILGKAIVETRGLFWAWWMHFLTDIVIFSFIAANLAGNN